MNLGEVCDTSGTTYVCREDAIQRACALGAKLNRPVYLTHVDGRTAVIYSPDEPVSVK